MIVVIFRMGLGMFFYSMFYKLNTQYLSDRDLRSSFRDDNTTTSLIPSLHGEKC